MLDELERLSKTADLLTEGDAKRIIETVASKLVETFGLHIVDVLWREEARDGIILRPFSWHDKTTRGEPTSYAIREDSVGIWPWVYYNCKPIWIERVRDRRIPLKDEITQEQLGDEYNDIFSATDSLIAYPLVFRNAVRGLICLEHPQSRVFTIATVELLGRIASSLSSILWKVDTQTVYRRQASEAVRLFDEAVRVKPLQFALYRSGFVVRSFDEKFNDMEKCIKNFMDQEEIQVQRYVHRPGQRIVIQEIINKIAESHFAIVDVTEFNPNVMLELGMILMINKPVMLLRRNDDGAEPPFDLLALDFHHYEISQGPRMSIVDPATNRSDAVELKLQELLDNVKDDPSFRDARPWKPPRPE